MARSHGSTSWMPTPLHQSGSFGFWGDASVETERPFGFETAQSSLVREVTRCNATRSLSQRVSFFSPRHAASPRRRSVWFRSAISLMADRLAGKVSNLRLAIDARLVLTRTVGMPRQTLNL